MAERNLNGIYQASEDNRHAYLGKVFNLKQQQLFLGIDTAGLIDSVYHDNILQVIEEERDQLLKLSKLGKTFLIKNL